MSFEKEKNNNDWKAVAHHLLHPREAGFHYIRISVPSKSYQRTNIQHVVKNERKNCERGKEKIGDVCVCVC